MFLLLVVSAFAGSETLSSSIALGVSRVSAPVLGIAKYGHFHSPFLPGIFGASQNDLRYSFKILLQQRAVYSDLVGATTIRHT